MNQNKNASPAGENWFVVPAFIASAARFDQLPACPQCKTVKFVAAMVKESDSTVDYLCCENGHGCLPTELVYVNISQVLGAHYGAGTSLGRAVEQWTNEFWVEIRESTDRAAGILAATMFDELLVTLLSSLALDVDFLAERLLGPNRPLGSFAARIDTCYLFGLITETEMRALNQLREIRNRFAHRLENLSFKDASLRDRVRNISEVLNVDYPSAVEPRKMFEQCVMALWPSLVKRVGLIQRVPRVAEDPARSMLMRQAQATIEAAKKQK